jgi:hypothetical protein
MCVWVRESVCVCVSECVYVCKNVCVCVRMCVYVCVQGERRRERRRREREILPEIMRLT